MTTGINIAIAGAIVLMLVVLGARKLRAAAPPVSPAKPVDPAPPPAPRPVPTIDLSGVTLTGSSSAPITIRKANIVESDFTGMLTSGTTVQVTPTSSPVSLACLGATIKNLGQCIGPAGNGCPHQACTTW